MPAKSPAPPVTIVILNWNNAADTLDCLASVYELDYPNYRVLVVDNGSTDDSVAQLRARYPQLDMLETGANLGYAEGNNIGIRRAMELGSCFVLILNNDVIVEPTALSLLVDAIESDATCVMATPVILDWKARNEIWTLGAHLNTRDFRTERLHSGELIGGLVSRQPFEVDVAPGSALLVRLDSLEQVGTMDGAFFLYFEEAEWCMRVRWAGFRILAVPAAVVWHKVSASLGSDSPLIDYYMVRNRLRLAAMSTSGPRRASALLRILMQEGRTIAVYTIDSRKGLRRSSRNARLRGIRDALLRKWGPAQGVAET